MIGIKNVGMNHLIKERIISSFYMGPPETFVASTEMQNEVTALKIIAIEFLHLKE